MALNDEITTGIKRYLWSVAAHLSHVTADERAEILQEVESHLYEGLHARFGEAPTAADLEALLAEMPRAESYGEDTGGMPGSQHPPTVRQQWNWPLILGIACLVVAAVLVLRGAALLMVSLVMG